MKKKRTPSSDTAKNKTSSANLVVSLLGQNKAVIHAAYGTFGEKFAEENRLGFHPEDILLGWRYNEQYNESTSITLRFQKDGAMDLCMIISLRDGRPLTTVADL